MAGDTDLDAMLEVNKAFYDAFERRDIDAMSEVWEHSEKAACTHPGWPALHGWAAISGSWFALFDGPNTLQFIVTNEHAQIVGDAGWVTLDENLLAEQGTATISAINVFTRTPDGWRLVVHHASAVGGTVG
jgi:ketosteroid isomerase-like protein